MLDRFGFDIVTTLLICVITIIGIVNVGVLLSCRLHCNCSKFHLMSGTSGGKDYVGIINIGY
jgi:hypothetical protein